jgi:hypothetical protein
MTDLDDSPHIFRHVGKTAMDGDFIEPAAFRRRKKEGEPMEEGLSVNWVEYFRQPTPKDAVPLLCDVFKKKGRKVGGQSKFALLNVGAAKSAAARYTTVSIVLNAEDDDLSHSLIKDYDEALNDQVAEQLAKVVIDSYPPKS